jgi:hypothetical protein
VASSVSCGSPCWVDGPSLDAGNPFRQFDIGARVLDVGTATAVQVPGGVFPGAGAMGVSASSGLSVTVNAGYCCVPSPTAGQGGYIFGTTSAQNLTLNAADPDNPRIDLVIARVYDYGTSASYCDIEVVTGTPASPAVQPSVPSAAIPLASVQVPAGAVALGSGSVTDLRSYVVAPGGILPIQDESAAPASPASQFMFNLATGQLCQGTGTAGETATVSTLPWTPALAYKTTAVSDSSGKGALTQILSVSITTDGSTDVEIYYKWPGFYVSTAPLLVTMSVAIDGTTLDQTPIYVESSSSGSPANGGSARYYTSSSNDTTPSAATHTVSFAFQSASESYTTTLAAAAAAMACLRVAPVAV